MLYNGIAIQLQESVKLLKKELLLLEEAIRDLARQHKETVMIGRSHAIHGEPITFGFKLAGWLAETLRNKDRLSTLEKDISVGPGRGSAAGSLVAYALKITDIDPMQYGLLFERFLNPERVSMPDNDIDFCMDGRDDVIKYLTEK